MYHAWAQDLRYCTISHGDHWPSGCCFMSSQGGFKSGGIHLVMILIFSSSSSSSSRLAAPERKVVHSKCVIIGLERIRLHHQSVRSSKFRCHYQKVRVTKLDNSAYLFSVSYIYVYILYTLHASMSIIKHVRETVLFSPQPQLQIIHIHTSRNWGLRRREVGSEKKKKKKKIRGKGTFLSEKSELKSQIFFL